MELIKITTPGDQQIVRVRRHEDLSRALLEMDLAGPQPVLVSIGGAAGMSPEALRSIGGFLTEHLVPLLDWQGVAVIDGGTDSGVMRAIGQARRTRAAHFPLVGVAAEGTVIVPENPHVADDLAPLEPNHTHILLVPGQSWGDESPWLSDVASAMSRKAPSATLLTNGGEISYDDAARSLESNRPVLVVEGTGRAADAIARAARGEHDDARAQAIAASPLTRVMPLAQPKIVLHGVADVLELPIAQ